jgi:signal transduction histidine kinase
MKKLNKKSFMGIMMVTSQLLLSLFLVYWLFSQFEEKKGLLSSEIDRGFKMCEQQMIDSLLATHYIDPFLNDTGNYAIFMYDTVEIDSSNIPISMDINGDSVPRMIMQISASQDIKHTDERIVQTMEMIRNTGRFPDEEIQSTITVHANLDSSDQLLMQGVKMLISTVGKLDFNERNVYTYFSESMDTVLFQRLFNEFIQNNYKGFSVNWKQMADYDPGNGSSSIEFKSYMFENPYGAEINDYFVYLLKSIYAQIIFALILIIITTLAFRLAYVNLKNQQKLIILKNDLISNITHELKTPVSTVKVALEALLDFNLREDPERTKEYLEMAHSETNRLDLLVNQVLNNSALESGNSFITKTKINIAEIIDEVLVSFKTRTAKQKASITFYPPDDGIFIFGDKLHLFGVIANLIDNSLKYNKNNAKIEITTGIIGNEIQISVDDNGIGIPDEYINKVFDKFFRVPVGDEHSIKGYGLGLNYASLVIKHHDGRIFVVNKDDGGCIFTICIPLSNINSPGILI